MAQKWAQPFYESPAWRRCRRLFLDSKHWLCERCGAPAKIAHHKKWLTRKNISDPNVTLSWSNLEALCHECHEKEHWPERSCTREGFAFDENGDLIQVGGEDA